MVVILLVTLRNRMLLCSESECQKLKLRPAADSLACKIASIVTMFFSKVIECYYTFKTLCEWLVGCFRLNGPLRQYFRPMKR